jgi:hypothetical protein
MTPLRVIAAGLALPLCAGCGNDDTMRQVSTAAQSVLHAAREAIDTARSYTQDHKDEIKATLEEKFRKLSEGIVALKARIDHAGRKAKPEWKTSLYQLQDKKQAVREKLREFQAAGERGWDRLKPQIERALDELEKAYQHCREQFQ